ncbi:MAG: hypothetical protein ACK6BN_05350 [Pseudanabaena sp.]|uniref:Uncharacterized protein n=1 Tax=Bacteriophage sp. TaxID=38018 RepID=A0A7G9A4Q4_9VIRU|nr:MAG: hypothetical protein [Bacteriophage sp.]
MDAANYLEAEERKANIVDGALSFRSDNQNIKKAIKDLSTDN